MGVKHSEKAGWKYEPIAPERKKILPFQKQICIYSKEKIIPFFVYRDAGGRRGLLRTNKYR